MSIYLFIYISIYIYLELKHESHAAMRFEFDPSIWRRGNVKKAGMSTAPER